MPSPWQAVEAGTDLLARARQIQRRWDRLLGEGALGAELSPEATAGLRPSIVESWRRTLATGLEVIDPLPSIEADPSETRERWLEHPLGLLRHVLAEPLQLLAEESNSLVQVTDASGLTLYLGGEEWLKAKAAEMNLVEGARCSETVNGTNGVGTALAADHPVQVFAFEHFSYHHREWVCSGAPIHDLVSGRLVGVIDLSSPWRIAHPRSLELVTSAARTTEQCLLEGRRDQDARLRRRYGDLTTKTSDLLVNREGYVLIGDASAHPKPLDIPESGGEIAMGDGSLAVAEPLGRGEAYLVRRPGPRRARAARGAALERAEERARELARKRAAPSRAGDPGRAGEVESDLPSPRAGEHLSAYLEAAIDCVIVADASGRIVEFNPAAERTFGYSRKEALGRTMAELIVPPSLRERHIAAFARFVKTREGSMLGRRVELTGMRADGSEFPVELALSQVEAEPVLICGALRDISATKQAEDHLRELAEEQAALRQVATLVAYESSPERLVAVVAEQAARVFDVPLVTLIRYEQATAVVVGGFSESDDEPFPIGSRWQLDTPGLLATIRQTGRAARVEDYARAPGDGAGAVRAAGMRSAVGSPIVVRGGVWGAIVLLSPRHGSLPEDTGARLADFTDLVATALANSESRAALRKLADQQAALRRVATMVARAASQADVFDVVLQEAYRLFGEDVAFLLRYESDGTPVIAAIRGAPAEFTLGMRLSREGDGVPARVWRTGQAARLDSYENVSGRDAARARSLGVRGSAGAPIVVAGRVWGVIVVMTRRDALPAATEGRLAQFAELVAAAIANAESRAELTASEARARELADEQAALRRVATLVAREASPVEFLETVTEEVARVLDVEAIGMLRFEPDGTATLVAQSDTPWDPPPLGTRFTLEGENVVTALFRTREAARLDDWATATGPVAEMARVLGIRSSVATPIVVEGRLWGTLIAVTSQSEPIPRETDSRIGEFTELVATAIANAGARDELSRLVEEQAALRRVATLVAEGAAQTEVFDAVITEVGQLLGAAQTGLARYENEHEISVLAIRGQSPENLRTGVRLPLDGDSVNARILHTGRSARLNFGEGGSGRIADVLRRDNVNATVGAPIVVDGALWGMIGASWRGDDQPPADAEDRVEKFTELVATAIANTESRAELAASEARARDLAGEQASLRRVATLVAKGANSDELFAAVTREAADVLDVPIVALQRYEPDRMFTMVAIAGETKFTVGSRWPVEDEGVAGMILATGRPARKDDYTTMPGPLGAALRDDGWLSAVGVPIVVEGSIWGFMTAGARPGKPTPDGTEERLARFTELVATAIADSQAREQLAQLAYEQAALRRVATLVARGVSPEEIFSAVTNEMGRLFDSSQAYVGRFEPDGSAMVVVGVADGIRGVSLGSRWELEDYMASTRVYRTGRPACVVRSDFEHISGPMADLLREIGAVSSVGAPIIVEGQQWGSVTVTDTNKRLQVDAEKRLEKFAELLATAIANAQSRAELAASEARARDLAEEQAARRRVATLVAKGAKSEAVFSAVAHEVAHVFGVQHVTVCRYEPDTILVLSSFEPPEPAAAPPPFPAGRRLPLDVPSLPASVHRTGEPVRIDDFTASDGLYALARQAGLTAAVGVPIVVDGTVWGAVNIASTKNETLRPDTEERLARFTELVATSVSNAAMRTEVQRLADEQASLRRVATLVAEGANAEEIFSAAAQEVADVLNLQVALICRYDQDAVLVLSSIGIPSLPAGARWPLAVPSLAGSVYRARALVRVDDFPGVSGLGGFYALSRVGSVKSAVGAPIVVDGVVWGSISAASTEERSFTTDAEERLTRFTDLISTAVQNAAMRDQLAASRARVITAADESRRRIERDLHDGSQQRLVTLAVALRRAEAKVPVGADELRADLTRVAEGLTTAVDELRELSRGIHPSILTEGGLSPALKALGRRSPVRVKLDMRFEHRLPDQVEVAAYYTVSEALTNASKHANATRVWVSVRVEDDVLLLSVRDDGAGGADPARGSGLTGLRDRIEALGGRIKIESPSGSGTLIEVVIPIGGPADRNDEPHELVSQATTPGSPG